jgi:rhodanese-related sulfurtransferase
MAVKRISPEEARDLMDKEGYVYLDVRSVPEFAAGHPTGAYNIPLLDMGPAGMAPNPSFLAVAQKSFPRDTRLVVDAGGRALGRGGPPGAGFTNLVDQRAGYDGAPPARRYRAGLAVGDRPPPPSPRRTDLRRLKARG